MYLKSGPQDTALDKILAVYELFRNLYGHCNATISQHINRFILRLYVGNWQEIKVEKVACSKQKENQQTREDS